MTDPIQTAGVTVAVVLKDAAAPDAGIDIELLAGASGLDRRITNSYPQKTGLDLARAEAADNNTLNALDPNLKPFIDSGGKLIQYHGWADPQISPANSTQYYTRVVSALGGADKVHGSYRLFMAPGMGHCGGGAGPNTFDMVTALEQWVEQGKAPDQILASHATKGVVDRTRPLCPYPQLAVYNGTGSIDEAANFTCKAP
jgi:feruloyl esterase